MKSGDEVSKGGKTPAHLLSARGLSRVIGWALLLGIIVLIWPHSLGGPNTVIVVTGQSMEPTMQAGDVAVVRTVGKYGVGDVIAYQPFPETKASVIHRITAIDDDGRITVRGDNNDFDDPYYPAMADIQGRMLFSIPKAGKIVTYLSQPLVWGSLILLAIGLYGYAANEKAMKSDSHVEGQA